MTSSNNRHLAGNYSGELAKTYAERRFDTSPRMQRLHQLELDFAREAVGLLGPDPVILDIPCGSGRFTPVFSKAKWVFSMDLSEDMLREARTGAPKGHKGEFIKASAMDIPIADQSVNLAFCMRLFHHISDPEARKRLLRELARVSTRWVVASFYRKESYRYYRKRLFGKKVSGQPIAMDLFEQEARECGLRVVDMRPSKPRAYLDSSSQTLVLLEKMAVK